MNSEGQSGNTLVLDASGGIGSSLAGAGRSLMLVTHREEKLAEPGRELGMAWLLDAQESWVTVQTLTVDSGMPSVNSPWNSRLS